MDHLFFSSRNLILLKVYCPEKNTWELGEAMTKQRSAAGVAVLDGYLYGTLSLILISL